MPAARGHLARLVVVVAVLAGLGLAVGLQCTGGMAMPMAQGASSADVVMSCGSLKPAASSDHDVPGNMGHRGTTCAMPAAFAGNGSMGSHGLGGVIATCLVFFLAVVAAVATLLRPGGFATISRMPRSVPVAAIRDVRPRALSLAELCLLRT
jgi:hypothetical protein